MKTWQKVLKMSALMNGVVEMRPAKTNLGLLAGLGLRRRAA
jgi:hypothetical protein